MKISDFSSFIYCSWSKVMWLDKLLENMLQKLHWFKVRKHWTKVKYPSNKLPLSLLPPYFISVHLTTVDRLIDETSSVCSFKKLMVYQTVMHWWTVPPEGGEDLCLCHCCVFVPCNFVSFLFSGVFAPPDLLSCFSAFAHLFLMFLWLLPHIPVLVFGSVIGDAFWFLYFQLFSFSLVFAIVLYFSNPYHVYFVIATINWTIFHCNNLFTQW